MSFREDGRVQELLDENASLKKANNELAARFARSRISSPALLLVAILLGIVSALAADSFKTGKNYDSREIAREVVAQIRQNPRPVYDRQWAAYFKEKIVAPAYREGVRDAREEFEVSRRAETPARPVLSADGRDLTVPPPSPSTLPLNKVVYGRITAGDVDSYLFHAQAGERVVFRMQATVGSWLSPHIVISTAERRTQLAGDGSSAGFGADRGGFATLEYTFETSGTYIVFCGPSFSRGTDGGAYALSARHR